MGNNMSKTPPPKWRHIKDERPSDYETVIVWGKYKKRDTDYCCIKVWYEYDEFVINADVEDNDVYEVEYWMPAVQWFRKGKGLPL
jgi:hypothetical protein